MPVFQQIESAGCGVTGAQNRSGKASIISGLPRRLAIHRGDDLSREQRRGSRLFGNDDATGCSPVARGMGILPMARVCTFPKGTGA